jgi:hypothetical protein
VWLQWAAGPRVDDSGADLEKRLGFPAGELNPVEERQQLLALLRGEVNRESR